MNILQILITNKMNKYQEQFDRDNVKIYAHIWNKLKDKIDFDKVLETKESFKDKVDIISKKVFTQEDFDTLLKQSEKYIRPCLIGEVNLDDLIVDIMIHISLDQEFERIKNMGGNFGSAFSFNFG